MTPREIYQTSLRLFNGDKYDKVTSQFELDENLHSVQQYPEYGRCFYHEFYLILSIKEDSIYINTQIIELDDDHRPNDFEPAQVIEYEKSLGKVIQYIRNNRIDYVFQNEV